MSETTDILWSGLTGRTGVEAIKIANDRNDVDIVAGIRREVCGGIDYESAIDFDIRTGFCGRWFRYRDLNNLDRPQPQGCDIIVDFSNPGCFEQIVELAVHMHVPLISGTSGLSKGQLDLLRDATNHIPVFRDGNFRFKVKNFIDEAVKLAAEKRGQFDLYENFYEGKSLPSETSKVLQQRVLEATGRTVTVHSSDTFAKGNLICDWEFQVHRRVSPTAMDQGKVHCRTIGFDELAHDVLEIAKVMKDQPLKQGGFYDLDEIWCEIPESAKMI